MHCPNCGTPVADGAAFCPNCGQPVKPATPNYSAPRPPFNPGPMNPNGASMNKSIPGVSGGMSLSLKAIVAGAMSLLTLILTFCANWLKVTITFFTTSSETFKLTELASKESFASKIGILAWGLEEEDYSAISAFGVIMIIACLAATALFFLAAFKMLKNPDAAKMSPAATIASVIIIVTCLITVILFAAMSDPDEGGTLSACATQWILILLNIAFLVIKNKIPSGSGANTTPVPPTMGNGNFGGYSPMR